MLFILSLSLSDLLGNDRTWDLAIVVTPEDLVHHPGVAFVAAFYSCSVEQMNPTKIGAGHRHGAFLSAITISLGGGRDKYTILSASFLMIFFLP